MPETAGQRDAPAQTDMPRLLRPRPRQIRRSYCSHMLTSSQRSWILFHALPAPAAAATTRAAAATRSHAGGATAAAGACTRSIETVVSPSEGVPVSASAARDIAAADAVRSARASAITGSPNPAGSASSPNASAAASASNPTSSTHATSSPNASAASSSSNSASSADAACAAAVGAYVTALAPDLVLRAGLTIGQRVTAS